MKAGMKEMPGGPGSLLAGEWTALLAAGDSGGVEETVRGWMREVEEQGELDEEACRGAVAFGGVLLGDVPEELRTEAVCLEAAWNGRGALAFVPERLLTAELCGKCVVGEVMRGTGFDDPSLWATVPEELRGEARRIAMDRLLDMGLAPEDFESAGAGPR